ncbi:AHH domain-containing protein [Desulfovibrio sp. JC010]|uniref:AHH domain-containing protein n=1 Tax=Desulfovibrio sp. JC010 TaxID=2593641 RepID=UPI0013D382D9|nr:AHH domain-containing protein [Desulfovibrio sp. JC010]
MAVLVLLLTGRGSVENSNADSLSSNPDITQQPVSKYEHAVQFGIKSKTQGFGKTIGGSSSVLRHRIGCDSLKNYAAHHIIPLQLRNHRALKKIGMDMDEAANGIALPTKPGVDPVLPLHRGGHPLYTAAVKRELDKIPPGASVSKTRKLVSDIQSKFRKRLEDGEPLHEKYGAKDPWC